MQNSPSLTFRYSDVNLFAGTISPFEIVTDFDSINQNIMVISATPKESKIWRPELGCNISKYLFDPIDDTTAFKIRTELRTALAANFEHRVQFISIDVLPNVVEQEYYIEMEYKVPSLDNQQAKFVYTLNKGSQ